MSNIRKLIIVGLASAGLGLGAVAVSANTGHHCHHGGFDKEKSAEYMQKRQTRLHDQLKLSAEQEPAWKTFTEKLKPASGERPSHEEFAGLKAPERMERMAALMKQREGRMAERVAAVKEFYAVLTPEQQQVFDANFMTRHRAGKGHAK
jgi:Spy/CpxP family protein refolding chaperone